MGWGSCGLFVMKVVSSSFSLYNNKQTKREKTRKNSVIGGHKIQECTFPTVMYVFFFLSLVYVTKGSELALCYSATNLYYF